MASDVRVPTSVLALGALALVLAIAAAAYFAGRSSREPTIVVAAPVAPVVDAAAPAPAPTASAGLPQPPPNPSATPAALPAPPAPPAPDALPATATATAGATSSQAQDVERDEVLKYFAALDRATAVAGSGDDPRAMAMQLLQQDPQGGSGIDRLARDQRRTRDAVAAIAAPSSCAEHQRRTLEVMDEGQRVLADLTAAMRAGDQTGLAALAAKSHAIEEKSKAVDELAAQLRTRYGL